MSTMTTVIHSTFGDDDVRVRRDDPLASHVAGDVSARTRVLAKNEIMRLIFEHGPIDGQELNAKYAQLHPEGDRLHLAYDSPRKRAGELVKHGLVSSLEGHIAANNLPAGAYVLTVDGLNELAAS